MSAVVVRQCFSISAADKEENEDAYSISSDATTIALADGATQSFLSSIWARLLVDSFINYPKEWFSIESIGEIIKNVRKQWKEEAEKWVSQKFRNENNIPSWVKNGIKIEGAASTLLGAKVFVLDEKPINCSSNIILFSIGIGDTCLFVIRNKKLLVSFPIKYLEEFSDSPPLLYSYNYWNERKICYFRMCLFPGDLLVFMTDKIAQFFLKMWREEKINELERLLNIEKEEEWKNFIEEKKRVEDLDDDLTQIAITIDIK